MRILILNGSPKKRFSASKYFSGTLKLLLAGIDSAEHSLRNAREHEKILDRMKEADAIILSVPLYVDGIPSHVLRFLKEAEHFCKDHPCRAKLYVLSNNGFIEGRQNRIHLEQYRCWCGRAGVAWGGGLGIGGGVMLHVLFYVLLVNMVLFLAGTARNIAAGADLFGGGILFSLTRQILVWLFLNSGALACLWLLSRAVRRGETCTNRYARVMLPSFLFLVVADVFMLASALLKGTSPFSLHKKDPYNALSAKDN